MTSSSERSTFDQQRTLSLLRISRNPLRRGLREFRVPFHFRHESGRAYFQRGWGCGLLRMEKQRISAGPSSSSISHVLSASKMEKGPSRCRWSTPDVTVLRWPTHTCVQQSRSSASVSRRKRRLPRFPGSAAKSGRDPVAMMATKLMTCATGSATFNTYRLTWTIRRHSVK